MAAPRSGGAEDVQPPAPRTGDVRADIRALVRVLGEAASVDLSADVEEGPDGLRVRVQGAGCAMLLEEEGEVFQALEHVLQRAYRARLTSGRLTVECEGYRDHRDGRLRARAWAGAGGGRRRRRTAPTPELVRRRIIHMVVSEHPALETYSVGEADRRVTIAPRRAPRPGRPSLPRLSPAWASRGRPRSLPLALGLAPRDVAALALPDLVAGGTRA